LIFARFGVGCSIAFKIKSPKSNKKNAIANQFLHVHDVFETLLVIVVVAIQFQMFRLFSRPNQRRRKRRRISQRKKYKK